MNTKNTQEATKKSGIISNKILSGIVLLASTIALLVSMRFFGNTSEKMVVGFMAGLFGYTSADILRKANT